MMLEDISPLLHLCIHLITDMVDLLAEVGVLADVDPVIDGDERTCPGDEFEEFELGVSDRVADRVPVLEAQALWQII